jgi:hypothetical protein
MHNWLLPVELVPDSKESGIKRNNTKLKLDEY